MKSVQRHADQISRLFNRSRQTWGVRDSAYENVDFFSAYISRAVAVSATRLPAEFAERAATARVMRHGTESEDHARLKLLALLWMESQGASDAKAEVHGVNGIADAYSRKAHWIVECGNTPFGKVAAAAMWRPKPRFTLIPFQPLSRWDDRTARRVFAFDFTWDGQLSERLQDIRLQRQRKAIECLELDDLPLPSTTEGA